MNRQKGTKCDNVRTILTSDQQQSEAKETQNTTLKRNSRLHILKKMWKILQMLN